MKRVEASRSIPTNTYFMSILYESCSRIVKRIFFLLS